MAVDATFDVSEEREGLVLTARGAWRLTAAPELDDRLRRFDAHGARSVRFDLAHVSSLDTAGAWLLLRTRRTLEAKGVAVAVDGLEPGLAPLLRQVESSGRCEPVPTPTPMHHSFVGFLARAGMSVIEIGRGGRELLGFVGLVTVALARVIVQPRRLRITPLVAHMETTGVNALPIVGLLSFLVGIVFAFQGADQLRRFGAEIFTVNLLGVSILRELGVLLTAIILAGRSGSAFTAQIGTMQVSEEIDAMRTIGLDPIETLVVPRFLALMVTLPLLAFYANVMGLFGGAVMSYFVLDIQIPAFLRQLHTALPGWTFWVGLIKAPFFASVIALVGCFEGLRVERSAESVGKRTTISVVQSIFLIIALDAVFTIVFSVLAV